MHDQHDQLNDRQRHHKTQHHAYEVKQCKVNHWDSPLKA